MALKDTLKSELTAAMRAKDTTRTATLRMALTAITNEEVAGNTHRDLDDAAVTAVLSREAKRRREAAEAYLGAGRPELAEREEAELGVLTDYLPAQLSEAELGTIVDEAIAQTGATGMPQMGAVMKVVQPRTAGRADGKAVAALVRSKLAG